MMQNWITKDKLVDNIHKDIHGFVYCIYYEDGKKYIGKKSCHSYITKRPLKRGTNKGFVCKIKRTVYRDIDGSIVTSKNKIKALRAKGIKGKIEEFDKCIVESNWRKYIGSSKEAKARKNMITKREILHFCRNKKYLSYMETKELFCREVLENENYINDNINGSYYRKDV